MKNLKKQLLTWTGIACLGMTVLLSPVTTLTVEAATATEETVSPCADNIGYRYKTENGKVYKRLFNYTTGEWIGDWIYVGEA